MKAVMSPVPEDILKHRKLTGADQRDEMWEGVLHMSPLPNADHQSIEEFLIIWLATIWRPATGGRSFHQRNVATPGLGTRWATDFRGPDLVMMLPDRFHIERNTHLEGGPTAVVEIRSPEDETYDKLPFYARIGVLEVWVIDRDTRTPELFTPSGRRMRPRRPARDGRFRGPHTNIGMRLVAGGLELSLGDDETTRRVLARP